MSAIHFDVTTDNSNIISFVEDTTKEFQKMSDYMQDLSKQGLDLSNAEQSLEVLGGVLSGLMDQMKEWGDELTELQKKQQEAMMAGDTDKVKQIGDEMKIIAENIAKTGVEAQKLETILSTSDKGREVLKGIKDSAEGLPQPVEKSTSAFSKMFKSVLPGLAKLGSIAGIVAVLKKVATDATNLTQRVGDTWQREVSGWKSSYESFVRSIGSGKGWTQMIQDMSKAYTIGKQVFDLMDELFEMQNSLTLSEAKYSGEIEENRQIMMDSTKSYKERKEAAQAIIDAETELGKTRQKVADQRVKAATLDLEKDTNLTKEEREFFIEKYNENQELIHQAMEYAEVQKGLALNEAAYQQSMFTNYGNEIEVRKQLTKEAEQYNKIISETPQEIKDAYDILMKYNEGSDKVIQTWVQAEAEARMVSANTARSTRRAETTKNRVEQEEKRANQAYIEAIRSNRIRNAREIRQNELEQSQAEIDAMKDGNDKVLAQIDLDYEREKQTIQNWYDDLREEKIKKAKELWNANPDNKGKIFTYNPNSDRWNATTQEQALFNDKMAAATKKYEKKRAEGVNAGDDTLNAYLKEYGSYWEKRLAITKEYQDKIDASDDDWEKKRFAKERDNELKSLARSREFLTASEDYEDKRIIIQQEAQDQIDDLKERAVELEEKLRNASSNEEEEALEEEIIRNKRQQEIIAKNTKKALDDLDDQYSDFYKKLAKDRAEWLVGDTVDLLTVAEQKLAALGDEKLADKDTLERIQRLKGEIKGLKQELSQSFTVEGILKNLLAPNENGESKSLSQRIKDLSKAWGEMTAEQKWQSMGGYITKIGAGLQKAAGYMKEIAELSGDSRLASTAEQLSAIAQNLSAAGQGAATGGGWGALAAGLSDLLGQTIEAFASAGAQEAIATKNANDWADALERMAFVVENSDFDTIFGTKNISLAQAKLKEAIGYLEMYQKKVGEDAVGLYGDTFKSGIIAFEDALEKGYTGLQRMLVTTKKQTGWAKFWGAQEEYTALGDLAPQLWKNGEFDVEAAKEFLKVNTQLTEEQRKQIENLVELKEGYDEAMKAVDDAISDTFGNLASDITDIIWDSVMNGTDAWEEFEKVGSEAIASLGKQLIQEMLISEYLEQYRDQMRKAYQSGSAEETQAQLRNIIGDIYGGMENMLAAGTLVAEEYKAWADEHGFDLTKLSASSQTAKAGGFETMSQDTANELNGRFTALQLSNEIISQSAQAGLEMLSNISNIVMLGNGTLVEIRNFHMIEAGYLDDISKQTKPIPSMVETLERIKENTDRL